ncbi:GLUG motif-containing protein [uncultured Parabacteroides sp.]|uniref:GLUG motif-containing protein n=1 Tax=uncultured Parabacteroides sp. TaxID=512312 RepID=UPI00259AEBCD|nr:GLUG motif-containing protein [uncultured Parabacteroides sp.]
MKTKITLITNRLLYLFAFLTISHMTIAQVDVWDGHTVAEPTGWATGNTTVNISSAAELAWVAQMVNNSEQTGTTPSDKWFKGCTLTLTTDIDLAGHEWTPIGIGSVSGYTSYMEKNFFGSFNGQNHIVSNLKITGEYRFAGLFGIIGDPGFPSGKETVKDLHVRNADLQITKPEVSDEYYEWGAGTLVGLQCGTIERCSATGKIVGGDNGYFGGLVGMNYGGYGTCSIISNSYASVDVTGGNGSIISATYPCYIGGFVGNNGTTSGGHPIIYNCYSTGNVKGGDDAYIGGFIGRCGGSDYIEANDVHSCYSLGTVEGGSNSYIGGFVGNAVPRSPLLNCYWNKDAYTNGTGNDAERTSENLLALPLSSMKSRFLTQIMNEGAFNYSGKAASKVTRYAWELAPGNDYPTLTSTPLAAAPGTSESDPFLIANSSELEFFATRVNAGNDFDGKYVKLTADIDLESKEWVPIGFELSIVPSKAFKGIFDGNGFQVQNLYFDQTVEEQNKSIYAGLFGNVEDGTIRNLGVVISEKGLTAKNTQNRRCYAGGIAAFCQGSTIENCYSTGGSISAFAESNAFPHAGGLVGIVYNTTISNCYSTVDVESGSGVIYLSSGPACSGGIVGAIDSEHSSTTISNCFSSGMICAKKNYYSGAAGGIIGYALYTDYEIPISNCLALNYKLITEDGNRTCFAGRILGHTEGGRLSDPVFSNNHAYDNIIEENLTNGTSVPISGIDATDNNGAGWDWRNSDQMPNGIMDNTSNWESNTLPIMPKLKTTDGRLMANQPDVSIPYPLEFTTTTNGSVHEKYHKTYAGKDTRVELTINPEAGFGVKSLNYQPEGEDAIAITESTGHYYFTMPGKKVTITAVFSVLFPITIANVTNGSISIEGDKTEAIENEKVIFTVTPDNGYKLDGKPTVTTTGSGNVTVNSEGNNKYSFDMPAEAVTIAATFSKNNPDPQPPVDPDPVPPVYYTVTLPLVEGAITDPVAGEYDVEAWSNFRFYLTLDKEYDQSEPVITTDRGETITPRSSDGAYIVKYVRNDMEIFIDGIVKNPDPVSNETIATDVVKVWAAKGYLHISSPTTQTVQVYNLTGSLVKQADIPAGDTRWTLPAGIYIVQVGSARYKVIL